MAKQRREAIEQFRQGGRNDLAEKEEAELRVIEGFQPAAAEGLMVNRFAEGLEHPRVLYTLPNGDVLEENFDDEPMTVQLGRGEMAAGHGIGGQVEQRRRGATPISELAPQGQRRVLETRPGPSKTPRPRLAHRRRPQAPRYPQGH